MNNRIKTAFTLVELLVVIAIVGILSGLIIVGMNSSIDSARIAKSQIFYSSMRDSMLGSLVSEWKFDNISGTVDTTISDGTSISDTWGSNNGTAYGSPTLRGGSNCIYGQCLQFNGSTSYVAIPSYNIPNNWTFSSWVKFGSLANQGIISYAQYDNQGIYLNGNSLYIRNYNSGSWINMIATVNLSLNKYYFITVTQGFDGVNYKTWAYIDGVQYAPTNNVQTVPTMGLWWSALGRYNTTAPATVTDPLNGYMDSVSIYSSIMPTSKIREKYYAGLLRLCAKGENIKNRLSDLNYNIATK